MVPLLYRRATVDALVGTFQRQYGPRALQRAAERMGERLAYLATGFTELDAALTIGGIPRGRVSELCGGGTSGKMTLAAHVVANALGDREALAGWLDLSATCAPDHLHRCGIDLNRLIVIRPENVADALAILLQLVSDNALAVIVFDGLADVGVDGEAALTGTLERLATTVVQTECAVLFLTEPHAQSRTLAHVAALRLSLTHRQWLWAGSDISGYASRVEVVKNKLGRAGNTALVRFADVAPPTG
jgi:recombination protein RecA